MRAAFVREGETAGRDQIARLMRKAEILGAKRRGKPWRTTLWIVGTVLSRLRFNERGPIAPIRDGRAPSQAPDSASENDQR